MNSVEPTGPQFNEHERKLHETAKLAEDLVAGLLGFDAALTLLDDDRVLQLVPPRKPGKLVPEGKLAHLDSEHGHNYHFLFYLDHIRKEPNRTLTKRLWASNSLIRIGDQLSRYNYFDRHPNLELVRHLRNAVAHGERITIDKPQVLSRFPAHLTAGLCHWEITPALHDQSLYSFVSAGDICSIIQAIGIFLHNRSLERHVQR
ncbi:MAG: hypothetical protein AB7F98_12115 [Novosphingobium sp.]